MQRRTALRTWMIVISVILFITATYVVGTEPEEAVIPLKELPAACKKAKAEFRPSPRLMSNNPRVFWWNRWPGWTSG